MTVTYAFGTWSQSPGQPGMSITIERDTSEEEFRSHADAVHAYESLLNRSAFSLMRRSHSNIKMMISSFSDAEEYGGNFRNADKEAMSSSLLAEMTNWLAATRLYLENERDFIQANFGDESDELKEFKSATAAAFESHEGYRFLYDLRNYVQHCGIPAGRLTISGTPPNRRIVINLDRSRLMTARFKWNRHAMALLERWSEDIPLLPLMEGAMEGYTKIEEQMLRINLRRCVDATPLLLETIANLNHSDGNAAAFRRTVNSEGSMTDIATCTFPPRSSLDSIISASAKEDPLETLRSTEPSPPPMMPTDGARASAVLSALFAGGTPGAVGDSVNHIMARDGGPDLLLSDLINFSAALTAMLSQLLGSSPHAVAARLSAQTKPD
ncbi:hypothetical protein [Streptomyces sp. NPDC057302]|uniref:hypothetical protein n=1 Tax=Streptomyces sp. NPDC057302 TaxID=3346094 RepID=UPI003625BB8E